MILSDGISWLQIVVALLVTWVLFRVANTLMMRNDVIRDYTKKIDVPILKGYAMTRSFSNKTYNTYNPIASNYVELPKSVNKFGGAQFTYTLWLRFDDVAQTNLGGKVIFIHGDTNLYEITKEVNGERTTQVDFAIKCPLVKFGPNGKDIIVEVNTTQNITERAVVPTIKSADEAMRHNVFSLIPNKFVMWTLVFEDDVLYGNAHESGTVFRMYVNDFLYYTKRFKGTLRLNKGNLVLLPLIGNDKAIENGYIADMTYYNRALTPTDVRQVMALGVRNKRYDEMDGNAPFNEPLYITEYNKLDIHNW